MRGDSDLRMTTKKMTMSVVWKRRDCMVKREEKENWFYSTERTLFL